MKNFKDVQFGFASAENESAENPSLLIDGFLDYQGASQEAEKGGRFLFLGYKGSGKSAIGERLRLLGSGKFDRFVQLLKLEDFPFTSFGKIVRGDAEPEVKYPTAWAWLLLIAIIDSFEKDGALRVPDAAAFQATFSALKAAGLVPNTNLQDVTRASAKRSFRVNLRFVEHQEDSASPAGVVDIPSFVQSLRKLVHSARSTSQHYLIIDGLDDILTKREIQYRSLGSLIFEADRLNAEFKKEGVPCKIIVLCRTDLFERITGANKNKIRQDRSVDLNWYKDPRDVRSSALLEIANLRASHVLGSGADMFDRVFPHTLERGTSTRQYLLDMTRHTPRDFLQLLKNIQDFWHDGKLTEAQVLSGCRQYSINYFLPEILDELEGYATPEEANEVLDLFGAIRKRELHFRDLTKTTSRPPSLSNDRIKEILTIMFECSALGNAEADVERSGYSFFTFKYRNRRSSLNFERTIILHKGLWKALSVA